MNNDNKNSKPIEIIGIIVAIRPSEKEEKQELAIVNNNYRNNYDRIFRKGKSDEPN